MRGSDVRSSYRRSYRSANNAAYSQVTVDAHQVGQLLQDLEYTKLAQKAIKGEIRLSMRAARKATVGRLKSIVGRTGANPMGDPRGTARAVKMTVYRGGNKSADGGNISILNKKGAAKGMKPWQPKRGGKSGIIRNRSVSARTKQVNSYRGMDRAFILRFLDLGTKDRNIEGKVSTLEKIHRKKGWEATRTGANRGKIPAGNFFGQIAREEVGKESTRLSTRIYKLIEEVAK